MWLLLHIRSPKSPEPWLLTEHFWSNFDDSILLCLLCLQYLPFYFGCRSLLAANRVSDMSWYDNQISIDRKQEIWYALSPRLIVRGGPFYFTWQAYLFIALIECPSLLLDRKPERNLVSDHDDSVVRCDWMTPVPTGCAKDRLSIFFLLLFGVPKSKKESLGLLTPACRSFGYNCGHASTYIPFNDCYPHYRGHPLVVDPYSIVVDRQWSQNRKGIPLI
jgi:hypothetical protein